MEKHKVAYIDEQQDDIDQFQRVVHGTLDVVALKPAPNLDEFLEELLNSDIQGFVIDFQLNEYRETDDEPIDYTGVDLAERILEIRKGFPCFVLTSFDGAAIMDISDVNYVYPKQILTVPIGEVPFAEKIRVQIEHYEANLAVKSGRFNELLAKSEENELTNSEAEELLKLDSFLESTLNNRDSLSDESKNDIAFGKLDELLHSTNTLLDRLSELKGED